jgi:uroporphyrinogen-III synthase
MRRRACRGSGPCYHPVVPPRVVVTRPARQASGLVRAFEDAGFPVALLPLLEVTGPEDPAPLDAAVTALDSFDAVVLTSANAVAPFAERLRAPLPEKLLVAVVGPATARAVREAGLPVHREAERAEAEGLVELLGEELRGRRVLFPRAADARPTLEEGLTQAGAEVTAVVAYDKRLPPEALARARELFGEESSTAGSDNALGWVTFTSPRIVRHFVELVEGLGGWEERRAELLAVSIGPVTTRELERFGVGAVAEAERPGDRAMVRAVERETRYTRS